MFQNRQKQVETRLRAYLTEARECVSLVAPTLQAYGESGDRELLCSRYRQTHRAESAADDIRREIEVMLFQQALFPESRGELLELLETIDRVPNQAEDTLRMLMTHHMTIPMPLRKNILRLANVAEQAAEEIFQACEMLLTNFTHATEEIGKVDNLESLADHIEGELIDAIFDPASAHAQAIEGYQKILLRDFVRHLSGIADRAEYAGNVIRVIVAKRKL